MIDAWAASCCRCWGRTTGPVLPLFVCGGGTGSAVGAVETESGRWKGSVFGVVGVCARHLTRASAGCDGVGEIESGCPRVSDGGLASYHGGPVLGHDHRWERRCRARGGVVVVTCACCYSSGRDLLCWGTALTVVGSASRDAVVDGQSLYRLSLHDRLDILHGLHGLRVLHGTLHVLRDHARDHCDHCDQFVPEDGRLRETCSRCRLGRFALSGGTRRLLWRAVTCMSAMSFEK